MSVFSPHGFRRICQLAAISTVAFALCGICTVVAAAANAGALDMVPGGAALEKTVDWASKQTVVELALALALVSILFSAGLVLQLLKVFKNSAKLWERSILSLESLRTEMASRPCVLPQPWRGHGIVDTPRKEA